MTHRGDVLEVLLLRPIQYAFELVRHQVVQGGDLEHAVAREQRITYPPERQPAIISRFDSPPSAIQLLS